jgi:hypothetical protein
MDVSDRIEKETEGTCSVLKELENEASLVVRNDWRDHICAEVALDLRRYRTYKGHSIRDLLRALRNKVSSKRKCKVYLGLIFWKLYCILQLINFLISEKSLQRTNRGSSGFSRTHSRSICQLLDWSLPMSPALYMEKV